MQYERAFFFFAVTTNSPLVLSLRSLSRMWGQISCEHRAQILIMIIMVSCLNEALSSIIVKVTCILKEKKLNSFHIQNGF